MSEDYVFCLICDASRDRAKIPHCPACSQDGKPRYEIHYRHGAGSYSVFDRWATEFQENSKIVELLNQAETHAAENITMYAAILEASTLGPVADKRCKLELQRIAKSDIDAIKSIIGA